MKASQAEMITAFSHASGGARGLTASTASFEPFLDPRLPRLMFVPGEQDAS
jgi:hypothetical protein